MPPAGYKFPLRETRCARCGAVVQTHCTHGRVLCRTCDKTARYRRTQAWKDAHPEKSAETAHRCYEARKQTADDVRLSLYTVIENPCREEWNYRVGARFSREEIRAAAQNGALDIGMVLVSGNERLMAIQDGRRQRLVEL